MVSKIVPFIRAFPPLGVASLLPQIWQRTVVLALSKRTCSFSQSLHRTLMNLLLGWFICLLTFYFKFFWSYAWWLMHFFTHGTCETCRNPPACFLASFWFWSWETSISAGRSSESPLSSFQFTRFPFFHLVNFVKCMFFAERTVSFDFPRNLHIYHSSIVTVSKKGI